MKARILGAAIGVTFAVALVGCSSEPKAPPRDSLVAQLQQEAEALQAENENQDTSIGVSTTWTIESVDVVEPPEGTDGPTRGTIRFRIRAETNDTGGEVQVDEFEKTFDYTFNTTLQKWVFDYQPS
ncbi:MAG: hypothetical protein LJF15_07795 [Acidobacteria bacterium]|jgi:hypothetical protein|nr:hypothetical protein [Acidobacteriota bacterium]